MQPFVNLVCVSLCLCVNVSFDDQVRKYVLVGSYIFSQPNLSETHRYFYYWSFRPSFSVQSDVRTYVRGKVPR